jgi:hypothetical protein
MPAVHGLFFRIDIYGIELPHYLNCKTKTLPEIYELSPIK